MAVVDLDIDFKSDFTDVFFLRDIAFEARISLSCVLHISNLSTQIYKVNAYRNTFSNKPFK